MMGDISNFYGRITSIAKHFGWTSQCLKFVEESSEAIQEVCHCCFDALPFRRQRLVEELADVYVVLLQLPILLDNLFQEPTYFELPDGSRKKLTHQEFFWVMVEAKIKRTQDRIESGYYDKVVK